MLQGIQEHRGTMVTAQILLLTVVLTLPSVENLIFRNPQYSVSLDKVRVLGRLSVWSGFSWLGWPSDVAERFRWTSVRVPMLWVTVCPPAWFFLRSDIGGNQRPRYGLWEHASHQSTLKNLLSHLWSSKKNSNSAEVTLFRSSILQWKTHAGWSAQYRTTLFRWMNIVGYGGGVPGGIDFLRCFDV